MRRLSWTSDVHTGLDDFFRVTPDRRIQHLTVLALRHTPIVSRMRIAMREGVSKGWCDKTSDICATASAGTFLAQRCLRMMGLSLTHR
jgi:hypothetical protein